MKQAQHQNQAGNALLEFTLVAIPLVFGIVSIVNLARGMWIYSTIAHAVKEGTRFAAVHGEGCALASANCPVTLGAVATLIEQAAPGLDPGQFNVTLAVGGVSQSCAPLSSCVASAGRWPAAPNNNIGLPVTISGTYPFRPVLTMFWTGAAPSASSVNGSLSASSDEEILF